MIPSIRDAYNKDFSQEKYRAFLKDLDDKHPGQLDFRVAESPVFIPRDFSNKMLEACESIVDIILDEKYLPRTEAALPRDLTVKNESAFPEFIAFDFGICVNEAGEHEPQLIEMQGFPTLFCWEVTLDDVFRK